MKKFVILSLVLCMTVATSVRAQEWTAPQVPGEDLTSLNSTTTVYLYNVEADAFATNGMDWNTNACATRLNAGDKAASEAHRCYAQVNGQTVSVRLQNYSSNWISCLSNNAYDIYVDQSSNYTFRFTETASGSHVYMLTNTTYNKLLDLAWNMGGHLTLADGAGVTKWAFLTESTITNGIYAHYKAQVELYRVYEAIVATGKTEQYAEAITIAQAVYEDGSSTDSQLQTAARNLFTAAASDITGPLDVSFLFQNADMSGAASCTRWVSGTQSYSWGGFEKSNGTLTLSQYRAVPAGLYDVCFRGLYKEEGKGKAPVMTVKAVNTVTADVLLMSALNYLVGNTNSNGWTSGENYLQPNNMSAGCQALRHPDAQTVCRNVYVDDETRLSVRVRMTTTEQWLIWQGIQIIYKGNDVQILRDELASTLADAKALVVQGGEAAPALQAVIDEAETVLTDTAATPETLLEMNSTLLAAMQAYREASVSVEHPLDWSDRLVNRSFENGFNGWDNSGMSTQSNTSFALKVGGSYAEKWTNKGNRVGDASFLQTVNKLGLGVFIVKAVAHNIQEDTPTASQTGAWIVGNLGQTAVDKDDEYTLVFTNIEKDAVIGFKALDASGNWLAVDNFQLLYAGGTFNDYKAELQRYIEFAESVLSLKMENSVRSALETAIANARTELSKTTADGYPAVSTPLRTLKQDAEVSSAAFARLQAAIDEALEQYGDGSNVGASDFLSAIHQAQAVNDDLNSTQAQMQAEIDNLQKAALKYLLDNPTGSKPRVTTDPRYLRGAVEAFGRMTVSGVTDSNIMEQGFCYSTINPEPTVLDECSTDYLECNGRIYRMPMQPATIYYIRAYCMTKGYQVGYGDVIKMCTVPMGDVTFTYYNNDGGDFHNNKNTNALTEACWYWSRYTSIRGFHVTANYSSGTPTADCGYGGGMRIGSNTGQRTGTMMHEMNHGIGGGTIDVWNSDWLRTGDKWDWAGERANAVLRFWENREDLVITRAYDDAHWGFREGNGSYSDSNMWLNKYAFNGSHLEAGNWAGPQNWNDTQICYIGNSLLQQGMCEDGLVPVNYWSGAFCLPAYVLPCDENQKYFLKCEDDNLGLYDSYLVENTNGTLAWKTIDTSDLTSTDRAAWYVSFTPSNQYYQIRNAATGHYVSFTASGNNGFKAVSRSSLTNNEDFHLIRGRNDVSVGGVNVRGYWLIHPENTGRPNTFTANTDGSTSAVSWNPYDSGSNQRWVFLAADDVEAFDQGIKKAYQADLRALIAQIRKLKRVAHTEDVADADNTLESTLQNIEAQSSAATSVADVRPLVTDARMAAMTFLSSVTPSNLEKPFDITFMIDNAAINDNSGWSETPTFNYSCCEYYERTFDFYQTLTHMPKGTYKLLVQAFQRPGSYETAMSDYDSGRNIVSAVLYVNDKSEKICHIAQGGYATSLNSGDVQAGSQSLYIPDNMESAAAHFKKKLYDNELLTSTSATDATLRIGLRGSVSESRYWTIFDNFRLHFYGSASPDVVTSISDIVESGTERMPVNNGVYDLQGRRLADTLEGLPRGIYIVGGKKVMVR